MGMTNSELHQQPKRKDRSTPGRRVTDLLRGRDVRGGVLQLLRDAEEPILTGDLSKQFAEREGFGAEIDRIGPTWLEGFLACSNAWSRQGWFAGQVLLMVVVECGRSPGNPRIKPGRPLRLTVFE